jgi:predicted Zn-dependent protease with MMP-like domain
MPFRAALEEVAVVIEDEPSADQRRDNDLGPDDTLYGLYEGVPRTEWGADGTPVPNKISLFRLPLEEDFPDPDDLADEVRITVIHELAHHLGIDDERLDELGID